MGQGLGPLSMKRRAFLGAASALALAGCDAPPAIEGGFTGIDVARGHALRDGAWRNTFSV